jgi:hypothetical protein
MKRSMIKVSYEQSRTLLAIIHSSDQPDHPPLFHEGIREEVLLTWRT